jgi:ligand-binding sensor protein
MTPLELKTKDEWQRILEAISKETGMSVALSDDQGKILIDVGERFPLCLEVRQNPESLTFICSQSNTSMLAMVKKSLRPMVEECEAGLLRMVVPVVHEGALIGQITACGVRGDDVDAFLISKQVGIEEETVEALAERSPMGDEAALEAIAQKYLAQVSS